LSVETARSSTACFMFSRDPGAIFSNPTAITRSEFPENQYNFISSGNGMTHRFDLWYAESDLPLSRICLQSSSPLDPLAQALFTWNSLNFSRRSIHRILCYAARTLKIGMPVRPTS
jgi:hypothetical protein